MSRPVHLVGSVPLKNSQTVMATCCSVLGEKLARIPDGETGIRSNWINWQRDILGSNPAIELIGEGKNADTIMPKYALREGFEGKLAFEALGYYSAAIESYGAFKRLKNEGIIGGQRFQVCLPTPLAAIACYVDKASQKAIFPAYKECLLKEARQIMQAIGEDDLAIQWDVAIEFAVLEGLFPVWLDDPFPSIVEQLTELADMIPLNVEVGFHFCYGDSGNKHFKEPEDMVLLVKLANHLGNSANRILNWIHMPVPIERSDRAYFQPLQNLDQRNLKQLFLGLLHEQDGVAGAKARMAAADGFLSEYGVATECGLGRRKPEIIADLLALHAAI